jgi:predicted acetyltransferase
MTNRPFRPYDPAKDVKTVQRIWKEVGWIDDDKDESDALEDLLKTGNTEVATINDEAECLVHWTPGTVQYQEETLQLGAVAAVTTSHISRKLGFAKDLTARSLAHQFESGIEVSALGIFDQGFYNKLGYGTGPYENLVQFDPATLMIDHSFRPPVRLTIDHYQEIHRAMSNRLTFHGSAILSTPELVRAEIRWTEKPFGLGYFDGPDNSLSHFIWGEMKGEHGPYEITARAYRNTDDLMELLALIKSLGDQVSSFRMLEFGEFQLQDLLAQPFRTRRGSKGGSHEQGFTAIAFWQLRILNLEACLQKTHLVGQPVTFNLRLIDPVTRILTGESSWTGLTGDYVVTLGEESQAVPGTQAGLPTLEASINAFSRMWFGVRGASSLAVTDNLAGDPGLLASLDKILRLPRPHFGWDF